jgi:hypothetical protein
MVFGMNKRQRSKLKAEIKKVEIPGLTCEKCGKEALRVLVGPVTPIRCAKCGWQGFSLFQRSSGWVILTDDGFSPCIFDEKKRKITVSLSGGRKVMVSWKEDRSIQMSMLATSVASDLVTDVAMDGASSSDDSKKETMETMERGSLTIGAHGRVTGFDWWSLPWVLAYEVPPVCACGSLKTWWVAHENKALYLIHHAVEMQRVLIPSYSENGRIDLRIDGFGDRVAVCDDCGRSRVYRTFFPSHPSDDLLAFFLGRIAESAMDDQVRKQLVGFRESLLLGEGQTPESHPLSNLLFHDMDAVGANFK